MYENKKNYEHLNKMKTKIFFVSAIIVMSISTTAFSAYPYTWNNPGGTPVVGTVSKVVVFGDETFAFYLTGSPSLCASGTNLATGWVKVGNNGVTSVDGVKNILSVVMAAKLSGKQVEVNATNGASPTNGCNVGAVNVL